MRSIRKVDWLTVAVGITTILTAVLIASIVLRDIAKTRSSEVLYRAHGCVVGVQGHPQGFLVTAQIEEGVFIDVVLQRYVAPRSGIYLHLSRDGWRERATFESTAEKAPR